VSDVVAFEDARWRGGPQERVWRHDAALRLIQRWPAVDVGGGDGLFATIAGPERVTVADVSPVAVESCRQRGVTARLVDVGSDLPFDDDEFATACALDVLEHLHDPLPLLLELRRVAPEVVLTVPNFSYVKARLVMLRGGVPFQNKPARGHSYWFNPSVLDGLVAAAGLRVASTELQPPMRLGAIGRVLARRRPSLFAAELAVRLERA